MSVKNKIKSQERKIQILEAAKKLCSKRGFSGTRLDDIAKDVGVSRALIVQYFGNKEKIYEELINFLFQNHPLEVDPKVTNSIQKKEDFEVLNSIFLHIFNHMTKDPETSPLKLILFSMLEKPELYKKHYEKRTLKILKLLKDYINQRIKDREFKKVDSLRISSFFIAAVIYLTLQYLSMPDLIAEKEIKKTISEGIESLLNGLRDYSSYINLSKFHGHSCIGLAIGYRAALIALKEGFKRSKDEEVFAIVENNSCSVDAIQFILGCTFGKGNLIFRDYGKQAFTIVERSSGKAIRISLRPGILDFEKKTKEEILTDILKLPDEKLFKIKKFRMNRKSMPKEAEIKRSVICDICGEEVMEGRTFMIDGKIYCIPCKEKISFKGEKNGVKTSDV